MCDTLVAKSSIVIVAIRIYDSCPSPGLSILPDRSLLTAGARSYVAFILQAPDGDAHD